jgi:phosphate transport system protein
MVSTVQKTITDLERIGDEAKKIAKTAKQLHTATRLHAADPPQPHRRRGGRHAAHRPRRLRPPRHISAAQVVRHDKEVDAEFKGIMRQLITYMIEDPRTISQAIELMFVAKSVERIGDHAKNIAEYVVYMVKGRDVRHTSLEEIEREATR